MMYEGNGQSDDYSTKRSEKQSYKSHWMLLNESDASKTCQVKVVETRGFRILNESVRTGSKRDGNESLFKLDHVQERGKGLISHNKFDLFSKSYRDQGTSKSPMGWMKSGLLAIDDRVEDSTSLKESSSREVDKGKAAVLSLMSGGSAILEQGNCNNGLVTHTPSTSGLHLQQFNQGWLQKMQNSANIGLFPMQFTKAKELQKFPQVVDMETMRICTMVDSVVGMPGGCPVFSQTTRNASLSKENENFRNTRVVTEKASNDHCGLSSFFGKGKQGLILQSLSSSTDSEGKGNVGHVKASKLTIRNESTDTLDMDNLNQQTGTNSSASIKIGSRETGLPDMNLPAGPAPASLSENADPSTSRTQSLDIDLLLPHPKPTFSTNLDSSMKADPNNRWVKRLKLNPSSALSTKSSKMSENLSHGKMSTYFSKILKNNITSSEDLLDSGCDLSKEDGRFSIDLAKDTKVLLSQTWIQRWLSDESRATQKKPGNLHICQPLSSKMELEDLEKKQFPSIAAMALMGKAMSGFQPCKLQKKGSFTVWNTKAF